MAALPNLGIDPSFQMTAPKPSGGMFGGGKFGVKEALAFGLAGLVSRRNPMLLQALMGAMMQKQKDAREESQYQTHRQDDLTDYGKKLEMSAKLNPPAPHYFEDNSGNVHAVQSDGSVADVYNDPNPWKLVPNGMGGVVPVNMQALMKSMGGGQTKPLTDADIERMTGGATGPAPSQPFPRYY